MEIEHRVLEIIAEQLGISEEEINPALSFRGDLGADSLDVLELIMAMEEEFELEISDPDAERIATVQELIDHITRHSVS